MLAQATRCERKVVSLPLPSRKRPDSLDSKKVARDENAFAIGGMELSGREWVQLLSLLSTVIKEDMFYDLDSAKTMAVAIDQHFQNTPSFQQDVAKILGQGGEGAQQIVDRLKRPPWER
ncbi:MAG: hypothetical protein HQL32_03090 [Planctomycetes bacterium]|nr:hypothetical protein [Planctomycetota bacterium]